MRELKKRWMMAGLAALALGAAGCARDHQPMAGDPNTQPSVDTDGMYFDSNHAQEQAAAAEPAAAPSAATPIAIVSAQESTPEAATRPLAVPTPEPATGPAESKVKVYETSEKWLNHNPEPSLKGLDRSGWEPTVFMTDPGTVEHYNLYHRDFATGYEKRHDEQLRRANAGEPTAVLEGYKTESFNGDNTLEMFSQSVKFGFDTILMFPIMVVAPPWGTDYTPKRETVGVAVKEKPVDITKVPAQPEKQAPKSDLPQLPAWPVEENPAVPGVDKPMVVPPLQLEPKQDTIPPLEFDNSPGM